MRSKLKPPVEPKQVQLAVWWVIVQRDQSEIRYRSAPSLNAPTYRIELIKDGPLRWEQTATNSLFVVDAAGVPTDMCPNRPEGVGWELHKDNNDHAIWRRRPQPATAFQLARNYVPLNTRG